MAYNPEFVTILSKYGLNPDAQGTTVVEKAKYLLVSCPSNREPALLAYGHIPQTYQEYYEVLELLEALQKPSNENGKFVEGLSLLSALYKLQAFGKLKTG